MLSESHERNKAWTRIWFLTQTTASGTFKYFKGLNKSEREELISDYYDFLDHERAITIGDRYGEPDDAVTNRSKAEAAKTTNIDSNIHNPNHYLFGQNKKWIPWAKDATSGRKRGQYAGGYPRGLVVHWTAGIRDGLTAGNTLMRNTGMLYLIGDKDGNIGQSDSLQYHGYHGGKSSHKYANGYVSDEYAGIELQAAGMLTLRNGKYYPWFNKAVPASQVVKAPQNANIYGGYYHKYTAKQLVALRQLVAWLYLNNPNEFSIARVVGHDEVSPGRKVDPGGSIHMNGKSLTMAEFRNLCWNDVDKITELNK